MKVAHHVNRDFKLLKKMLLYTKGKNVTLRLIANNLCLHMCPYSIMHGTVQGHFSCSDSCSRGDIDYCLMKCLSTKIEDMSNLISSDWIRPEDLCYYEKLCEETDNFNLSIKLVERTKSTKFLTRVVEAYARRQYKGNLLDILLWPKSDDMVVKTEPTAEEMKTMAELYNISQMFNYSKIFDLPNIYIDNTKLDGLLLRLQSVCLYRSYRPAARQAAAARWISPHCCSGRKIDLPKYDTGLQGHRIPVNSAVVPCSRYSQGSAGKYITRRLPFCGSRRIHFSRLL